MCNWYECEMMVRLKQEALRREYESCKARPAEAGRGAARAVSAGLCKRLLAAVFSHSGQLLIGLGGRLENRSRRFIDGGRKDGRCAA